MDEKDIEEIEKFANSDKVLKRVRKEGQELEAAKKFVLKDEMNRLQLSHTNFVELSGLNLDAVKDRAQAIVGALRYITATSEEAYAAIKAAAVFFEYWCGYRLKGEEEIRAVCDIANEVFPGKVLIDFRTMSYKEFMMMRAAKNARESNFKEVILEEEENGMYG